MNRLKSTGQMIRPMPEDEISPTKNNHTNINHRELGMKTRTIKIGTVLVIMLAIPIIALSENLLDFPPSGTDGSSLRCGGGIISLGDHPRVVSEKCGDPVDRGRLSNRKYDVWVYHKPGANFVYYLGFFDRRLQRIYTVSCVKKDPYCD